MGPAYVHGEHVAPGAPGAELTGKAHVWLSEVFLMIKALPDVAGGKERSVMILLLSGSAISLVIMSDA